MFTDTHSPGKLWSLCMHKKETAVCTEKQDIACLQMADAEFCICKLFCRHIILLKNCLGAEIQLLLHWRSFLIYGENEDELGKHLYHPAVILPQPTPVLAFH